MTEQDLLIVFARRLRPGEVKTRLIKGYGAQGALAVYRQLLDCTLGLAGAFPGQVCLSVDQHDQQLQQIAIDQGWHYALQQGDGLGERMSHALAEGLARYRRVLLIGSDCVALTLPYLQQALAALEQYPVVFGGSEDGGYVLLGSCDPQWWQRQRFQGVRFGQPQALRDSLACFPEPVTTTLPALWDVDEPEDVARAVAAGYISLQH